VPVTINGSGPIAGASTLNGLTIPATGFGKVLQVIYASTSTAVTVTSTTYTDTGLSATITPSATSSKVLILVAQSVNTNRSTNEAGTGMKLLRGSTEIFAPDAVDTSSMYVFFSQTTAAQIITRISMNYLDSPSTTAATTYKTQGRPYSTTSSGSTTFQHNGAAFSTMILMEVAA